MTDRAGFRIGAVGHLALFVWAVLAATLTEGLRLVAVLAVVFLASWGLNRSPRALRLGRYWLFIFPLLVTSGLLIGVRDLHIGPLELSSTGLATGLWIALRAVVFLLAIDLLTGAVSPITLAAMGERFGLRGLGFALGIAVNLLPTMQRTVGDAWIALRLRGGMRRHQFRALRLFLVTVTANALDYGDMVLEAAMARAFTTEWRGAAPRGVGLSSADLWVCGLLVILTMGLCWRVW